MAIQGPTERSMESKPYLVLTSRVVKACVQHDGGEREHVAGVAAREHFRVTIRVSFAKRLHHSINLL